MSSTIATNNTQNQVSNAPKFFVDHKKGEVVELMNLLRNPNIDRDINKKKDIVKRVIAYMTLGVDASFTDDIVLKKMVFLYIVNYADESESAILAINTFLRDLKNTNAKIRGLALRSLCSLKFKGAYDYYANSLYDALKDSHPYVRKTAVVGLLKVYHLNPKLITEKDIETLYEMIKDKDSIVVTNTLNVLNEILKKEGGISISSKMIIHLLNNLKEFNEWGQNVVLEIVSRYTPKDEEQLYAILNILEDKLKHSSTAIVLACTRVLINYTKDNEFIYSQVINRLREPFITLITTSEMSGNNEICYVLLCHIYFLILKGGRKIFSDIYKNFFIKFEEPFYVKKLKLEILVQVANESNYSEILNEMEEYANDVNSNFAKHVIRKIGSLGLRVDQALVQIVNLLKSLLTRSIDYIVAESLCLLQNLLRKYPSILDEFSKVLESAVAEINCDPKGLSAVIWILGEFGDKLDNAAYLLENLLDQFVGEIQPPKIIYALLLAGAKLFFKSPGETQLILGRIFEMILKNYNDVDLRDRTYYIYNLLQKDVNLAEYIICGDSVTVDYLYSDLDDEFLDQIYSEFNTLSIIYRKPEEKFIKNFDENENYAQKAKEEEEAHNAKEATHVDPQSQSQTQSQNTSVQKNDFDEIAGNLNSMSVSNNNNAAKADLYDIKALTEQVLYTIEKTALLEFGDLDENQYQKFWREISTNVTRNLKMSADEIDAPEFVKYLESEHIFVKAYGEANKILKMYLYSKEKKYNNYHLIELILDFNTLDLNYTLKSLNNNTASKYEEYFMKIIEPIL